MSKAPCKCGECEEHRDLILNAVLEKRYGGWKLFLDDERLAPDDTWNVAKTVEEAMVLIARQGPPAEMSLDFDLGHGQLNGHKFVDWFCDQVREGAFLGTDTLYAIHSAAMFEPEKMADKLEQCLKYCAVTVLCEWWLWDSGYTSLKEYADAS